MKITVDFGDVKVGQEFAFVGQEIQFVKTSAWGAKSVNGKLSADWTPLTVRVFIEVTKAHGFIFAFCDGSKTPSCIRSMLNDMSEDAAEAKRATYWKLKDGSVVMENNDGVFSEVPANRFPT